MNTRHHSHVVRPGAAPGATLGHTRRPGRVGSACLVGLVTVALSATFSSPAVAYFHGAKGMVEGPAFFSLGVTGSVKDGATVSTTLAQPIRIGLFVETKSDGIGLVPLGAYTAGTHQIHWDLRVNGKQLVSGKYAVFLEIFDANNRPSGVPPSRFEAVLTISKGGRDSVRVFTIKYPEL